MKATILVKFQDRLTKKHYAVGQTIDVEGNRFNELVAAGVVKAEGEEAEYVAEPLKKTTRKKLK